MEIPEQLPEVNIGHLSTRIDELLVKATIEGAKTTLAKGLVIEAEVFGECLGTKDMGIGMGNFLKNGPKVKAEFVNE